MKQHSAVPTVFAAAERPQARDGVPALVVAKILASGAGGSVEIAIDDKPVAARRALSCLLEPVAGDRVLVARTAEGFHVLAILERVIPDRATLSLPSGGALTIAAGDIHIAARGEATIDARSVTIRSRAMAWVADSVTLAGRLVTLVADAIRLSSKTQEVNADTISSKSLDRITIVDRADVLRAGSLTQTIDEVATTTAPIAIIATREDLRLDGKRVTVG